MVNVLKFLYTQVSDKMAYTNSGDPDHMAYTNSADPDQTAPDLSLHCFPFHEVI